MRGRHERIGSSFGGGTLVALGLAVASVTACASSPAARAPEQRPWRVITGPAFYTGDPDRPWATTVVIDEARRVLGLDPPLDSPLLAAGGAAVAPWELPGALATAGLTDAHVHLHWIGQAAETADLRGARDAGEVVSRVSAAAVRYPQLPVVRGFGWDEAMVGGAGLGPRLDAIGDPRPVALTRIDGHALWLNRAGLDILASKGLLVDGLEASAQVVVRDERGLPTGLIVDPALGVWNALADPPDLAEAQARFERALRALAGAGLAAAHDMATRAQNLDALVAAQAAVGPESPRIAAYLEDSDASWAWLEGHAPGPFVVSDWLEVRGVKLFADGALGSRGAALREPYADAPDQSGTVLDQAILNDRVARAVRLGFDVAIHAIGDRAVGASLDAFEAATRVVGPRASAAHRHRIEHAQIATAVDRARFAALGVIASMQPTHGVSDSPWACARLGPERGKDAYAIKDFRVAGVHLALGSDAPIETFAPLVTLGSAVTPADQQGACTWLRHQKISPTDAIDGMTVGAAYAAGQERRWGRIAVGYPLELTLFDVNMIAEPDAITQATVIGRITTATEPMSFDMQPPGTAKRP